MAIGKRKSKYTREILEPLVQNNLSMVCVIRDLGLKPSGGNHSNISRIIKELKIDTSHFTGQGHLKGKTHNWTKSIPLEEILVEDSNYSRHNLKKRLLELGLLQNKCSECGISEWNGKHISIQIDHKNGIHNDNRIENLRMLCPNCHSQTDTFSGKSNKREKNKRTVKIKKIICPRCLKNYKNERSKVCIECYKKSIKRKFDPPIKEFKNKIEELKGNMSAVGRFYKVSDNAIRKRIQKYNN